MILPVIEILQHLTDDHLPRQQSIIKQRQALYTNCRLDYRQHLAIITPGAAR